MNFIKRHLSLIYPLLMLLFSVESVLLIQRAVEEHEKKLSQDYSIVIASKEELVQEALQRRIKHLQSIQPIDPQIILKSLEHTISPENLAFLKSELPLFYSITLDIFPNQSQLKQISSILLSINGVQKVELFAKTHSKVYRLLLLLKKSIVFFGSLLGILSILLMVKQVEVWLLQHSKRMEIMSYLGAPSWMKNKVLFKLALIDSVISSVLVIAGVFYVLNGEEFQALLASLEISNVVFAPLGDFLTLLLISVCISTLSAAAVILRQKDY
ncbi:FtsX-like permease family protein [Helicobacter pametensis]|uniref:FtsX-like permease family protein n=1 Tax=Helicobacter pametensis TaxID=95149 RepID=UPI0004830CAD|nr:FtsX-like permease family protein [Helicobacter pametensis]